MNTRKLAAALAAAVCAGLTLSATTGAHAQTGPYNLLSAANPANGMQETTATWTDGQPPTPVTITTTTGYGELTSPDGLCITLAGTTLTPAKCTGAATQEWQSATHAGFVLWWNKGTPGGCKFGTGTTQEVISAPSPGSGLDIACPPGTGPAWPYTTAQEWQESPPAGPSPSPTPTPAPTPSQSSTPPPPPSCAAVTAAPVPAPNIPAASHVGQLETSLNGTQLATWDSTQTEYDTPPWTLNPPAVLANGDLQLHTKGTYQEEAGVYSCSSVNGTGGTYLYGTFEIRASVQDNAGACVNFPAFWLSNPVQADWPVGGEADIFECLAGKAQAHYHAEVDPGTVNGPVTNDAGPAVPVSGGYHTWTAQWGPDYFAVWMDGTLQWTDTSDVEGSTPLEVILNNAVPSGTSTGVASDFDVTYLRVWAWQ
jgi:hypothetical protein